MASIVARSERMGLQRFESLFCISTSRKTPFVLREISLRVEVVKINSSLNNLSFETPCTIWGVFTTNVFDNKYTTEEMRVQPRNMTGHIHNQ